MKPIAFVLVVLFIEASCGGGDVSPYLTADGLVDAVQWEESLEEVLDEGAKEEVLVSQDDSMVNEAVDRWENPIDLHMLDLDATQDDTRVQETVECVSIAECNDDNDCTLDLCVDGHCEHQCMPGRRCGDGNSKTTCRDTQDGCACVECERDEDCDDQNICTSDVCVDGVCEHGCSIDSSCDDHNDRTFNDRCAMDRNGLCRCLGTPVECVDKAECDDNNSCTEDSCIGFTCHHTCLQGTLCDDGNPDTFGDKCTWEQGSTPSCVCQGRFECTEDNDCDDKNPCTSDRCENRHCYHECNVGQGCQGDWLSPVQGYCVMSNGQCGCFDPSVVCDDPFDCPPSQYCDKDEKMCGSLGVCKDRPTACPLIYRPVCGCDGETYHNHCSAYLAGTSVWYEGECTPTRCFANIMCPQDQYCSFVPCTIETGGCIPKPIVCLPEDDPVCGCDDRTYNNACLAASAGVSIWYLGACGIEPM